MNTKFNSSITQDDWWKTVFFDNYVKRERKVIPFGIVSESAAWLYELVRCSPEVGERKFKLKRRAILPPFPELKRVERDALEIVVEKIRDWRPIWRWGVRSNKMGGYSVPLPSIEIDLMSDEAPFVRLMRDWLKLQRKVQGCKKPTGEKGSPSHNKKRKNCNWAWVEALTRPPKEGLAFSDRERRYRSDGRKLAREYAPLVINAVNSAYDSLIQGIRAQLPMMAELYTATVGKEWRLDSTSIIELVDSLGEKGLHNLLRESLK